MSEYPRNRLLATYEILVVAVAVGCLVLAFSAGIRLSAGVVLWIAVVAAVELAPVPFWRVQVSLGFPLLLAVALLYPPAVAGLIAFAGSFDPRELRLQVGWLRALFNRSQVAVAVMAAGLVFHSLGSLSSNWIVLIPAAIAATAADWLVNFSFVAAFIWISEPLDIKQVVGKLFIGNPWEFFASYLGLAFLGVVLAKLYVQVGFWSVGLFIVPLFLARQMFFRSRALEEAHEELQDRAKVLRRLSNRMAEERQDERMQIAGYLHDDLAQLLFQLSLQTDLVERLLGEGDIEGARAMLADLRDTKELASERMRSLVSDLHRSPIGRKGLSEALRSFTDEVGRDAVSRFELEVVDLPLPPPIQLLVYQIAHEAVMNALKYADASTIEISFAERAHAAELVVRDDGAGFDTEAGEPEGHYGLTMMRERATVAGGTFDIVSARGHGTAITVRFPAEWLQTNGVAQTEPSEEKRPKIPTPVEATPTPPVDARTDFA